MCLVLPRSHGSIDIKQQTNLIFPWISDAARTPESSFLNWMKIFIFAVCLGRKLKCHLKGHGNEKPDLH